VVTATGNVTGGNITTAGVVTATGNVAGGNITTAGVVTATGNVNTAAGMLATGNISGGNILYGSGAVSGTGNITGGNVEAVTRLIIPIATSNPADPVPGQFYYNSSSGVLRIWTGSFWDNV
jgi:uncharacterized membrane protein